MLPRGASARATIIGVIAIVLAYALFIHDPHVQPKVKAAHFLLRMLTLGVPRWVVTQLIQKKPAGHWDGVRVSLQRRRWSWVEKR